MLGLQGTACRRLLVEAFDLGRSFHTRGALSGLAAQLSLNFRSSGFSSNVNPGQPSSTSAQSTDDQVSTSGRSSEEVPIPSKRTRPLYDRLMRQSYVEGDVEKTIVGSAIIERYPIVYPALPAWELDYLEWQAKWNEWKYKKVPLDFLNTDKVVDDTSEVWNANCPCQHHAYLFTLVVCQHGSKNSPAVVCLDCFGLVVQAL